MVRRALLLLALIVPVRLRAQADTTQPHLRATFPPFALTVTVPESHRLAALLTRPGAGARTAAWDSTARAAIDSARQARGAALAFRSLFRAAAPEVGGGPDTTGFLGLDRRYADIRFDGQGRVEIRTDRLKNERCTPYQLQDPASGCQGTFTPPRIDNEFAMQANGTIGQRLHLNMDYDSHRDFSASNDIRVYYQGLEDEVVQRVEFGTVTFTPPPSRFITAAIPANSFGVNARFQVGALQVQALAASQKGSVVAQRTYTVGATTAQPQDRQARDLDYESGRFFWAVDPALVPGYPEVDALNVDPATVAADQRPVQLRVYRYRPATQGSAATGLTGITALADRTDSDQKTGRLRWELLVQGVDYYLDPSGLWFVLVNKLDANDYLAVSYVTAAGTRIGTFPAQDNPAGNDTLELIVEPRRGPEVPTFRYEMRQMYRVAGADLDRSSLSVAITVNQSERPLSGAATYLAQLGLAVSGDAHVFDTPNRLFPRDRDAAAAQLIKDSYIAFPTLQPFADPQRLQPVERNDSLYRTPDYLLLTQGPPAKFAFRLKYTASLGGDRSTLDLNAFQIRPGSEQLEVNGQVLQRDVDYTISYDLGQVTFLEPDQLFGNAGAATVTARFEERGIFAVAPTSIFGLTSTYKLGQAGDISLIGIYQRQQSAYNRPPLGFEPTANFIGGVTTNLTAQPDALTRLMDRLTPAGATAPSRLDFQGEYAVSKPNANEAGAAYLEEFEEESGLQVPLRENLWGLASKPQRPDGLEGIGFAAGFDSADATMLSWQNLVYDHGAVRVVRTQDIDSLIVLTGGAPVETVLYLDLHPDTAGGYPRNDNSLRWILPARPNHPRWRSMVTPLSQTGTDLSNAEYLEFWVYEDPQNASADSAGTRVVLDVGSVNEDALAVVPESLTISPSGDSTFHGRRYSGVGRLDTEREATGVFNAADDDNGVLADRPDSLWVNGDLVTDQPLCRQQLGAAVPVYPWGDLGSRCTNGNGTLDGEDLNGDNVLNATGANDNVQRYIVDLANSPYFVRSGGSGWRLYRVPLARPDAVIGSPNLRLVQQLRVTVATPPTTGPEREAKFGLARMRFVGASWVRRSATVIDGLSGSVGAANGQVTSSIVSTEDRDLGYTSPPGVVDQTDQKDVVQNGLQVNERSLRLLGTDLHQGQRAEAYYRFPAGPQNLLKYRTLRIWFRGRGPGWDDGELQAVFKAGTDDRDFYAYRVSASTTTWLPEVRIDLDTWRRLRAQIEVAWLTGHPPSGAQACGAGDTLAYVACDGPYLVQVGNPGISPPNLAAVQEVSAAIYRVSETTAIPEAELWVDDIRMTDPVSAVGTAYALSTHLAASDVGDVSLSLTHQDGNFQQLGQSPTYQASSMAQLNTSWRLDRFLPKSWGLSAPLTATYSRTATDPQLLEGTDLNGADLAGLRRPSSDALALGLGLHHVARSRAWLAQALWDPLSLNGSLTRGSATAQLATSTSNAFRVAATYSASPALRGIPLDLGGLVGVLPGFLRNGAVGRALRRPTLRWSPLNVRWSSTVSRDQGLYTSYQVPVAQAADSLVAPSEALTHLWRNTAGLTLVPFPMLSASADLVSTRDLRTYADSTPLGRLAGASRRSFLGLDAGVERDRQVATSISLTPALSDWLRPRYVRSSFFQLNRYLTGRQPIRSLDDTAGVFLLPKTISNAQTVEYGATVDLAKAFADVAGTGSGLARFTRRFRPVDLSRRTVLSSTFDLPPFEPSLGYELAGGGIDRFLAQGGQLALAASDVTTDALRVTADLPGGLSLSASYGQTATARYSRFGTGLTRTDTRQTDWPVGSARITHAFTKGPVAVVSSGVNIRYSSGSATTPTAEGPPTSGRTSSSSVAPDATFTFRNGVSLTMSYSLAGQRMDNAGSSTRTDQGTLTTTLNDVFRLPESLSRRRKQARASLTAVRTTAVTCLETSAQPGCQTVSDFRRTDLSGGIFTDVLPLAEAGISFGYTLNDVRQLSQRTSNLFVSVSLNIQLTSQGYR